MCALMADSLLTGLPTLVKPTGSFSENKACIVSFNTNNKLPFLPCSYLFTFQFMSPFISRCCFQLSSCLAPVPSWKKLVDSWQPAAFFPPTNMPRFYDWPIKVSLKLPTSKYLGENQRPHITGGQGSTGSNCDSSCIAPFPFATLLVLVQHCYRRRAASTGGKGRRRRQLLFQRLCPSCVMAVLGFHVLSGWVSCSSSLLFPHWKSVSLRGRRRSLLHPFRLSSAYSCMSSALTLLTPAPRQTPLPCMGSAGWWAAVRKDKAGEDTRTVVGSHHHCLLF